MNESLTKELRGTELRCKVLRSQRLPTKRLRTLLTKDPLKPVSHRDDPLISYPFSLFGPIKKKKEREPTMWRSSKTEKTKDCRRFDHLSPRSKTSIRPQYQIYTHEECLHTQL